MRRRGGPNAFVAVLLLATLCALPPSPVASSPARGAAVAPSGAIPSVDPAAAGNSSSHVWGNISSSTTVFPPGNEFGRSVAYDPVDGYVLLFGGYVNHTYLNETWTFSRGAWTELFPSVAPPARDHAALVYDASDGYMVLFGGANATTSLNDTWAFLGGNWTELHPSNAPQIRWAAQMTYDPVDGYVLLFGGCNEVELNDTWTFRAGVWTELALPDAPAARREMGAAWDPSLNAIVLFGGSGESGLLNDTWSFRGGLWQNITPTVSPAPRAFPLMSNDTGDGYLVLFGGATSRPAPLNDTWVFEAGRVIASASPPGGEVPLPVSFNATGFDEFPPVWANWTFGDGGNSSMVYSGPGGVIPLGLPSPAGPYHVYRSPGAFVATLTMTDRFGSVSSTSLTIYVVGPPGGPVALSVSTSGARGVAPLNVSFVGSASRGLPPYQFTYSFGDGTNGSGPNATHLYEAVGFYNATVQVTDAVGQSASTTIVVEVAGPLLANLTVVPTAGTAPTSVRFNLTPTGGIAPYSAVVDFGDGSTTGNWSGSHTYRAAGTYALSVTLLDSAGDHIETQATIVVHGPGGGANNSAGLFASGNAEVVAFSLGAIVAGAGVAAIAWSSRPKRPDRSSG